MDYKKQLLFNYINTLFHQPANAKYQRSEVKTIYNNDLIDWYYLFTNQKAATCVVLWAL